MPKHKADVKYFQKLFATLIIKLTFAFPFGM